MAPVTALSSSATAGALPPAWLDDYVHNNTVSIHQQTQSAIDIYMASALPTGMTAGVHYWQVANGYTAMALHDLWSGFNHNRDALHENLITVMHGTSKDYPPDQQPTSTRRSSSSARKARGRRQAGPNESDGGSTRGPGFVNEFNDDSLWWALDSLETWCLTGDERLINAARHVWEHIRSYTVAPGTMVGDVDMSGGIIWTARRDEGQVNVITTGLFAELGARLALYEPRSAEKRGIYLEAAQKAVGWILRTRYDEKEHVVMDTIDCRTGERHDWTFTYNTGQTIAATLALYQALSETPEYATKPPVVGQTNSTTAFTSAANDANDPAAPYLRTALALALPALTRSPAWVDADGTLTERSAYPGTGDGARKDATQNNDAVGFKSVLLRSLVKLYRTLRDEGREEDEDGRSKIKAFVQWQWVGLMERNRDKARPGEMRFGPWWAGPWDTPTSHSQMAALDVVAGLWGVTEKGPV